MSSKGEFAHGKIDPREAGKSSSSDSSDSSPNLTETDPDKVEATDDSGDYEPGTDADAAATGGDSLADDGQSGSATGGDYKPTEHGGLKQDGTPDRRVKGNE